MIAKIKKSQLNGEVAAIPSKSYAHRILMAGGLCEGETKINGLYPSKDVLATIQSMSVLGATYKSCKMSNSGFNHTASLNVGESGSTLRFLIPIVSAIGGEFTFICKGRLLERTNEELVKVLSSKGIEVKNGVDNITVCGQLQSGEFRIRGDVSSQYISGLLMALPLVSGDSEIVLTTELSSKGYVDITLDILSKFGIEIEITDTGYKIKGGQKYVSCGEIDIEGDWSNSCFFLTYGVIAGGVTVYGLNENSKQGDRAFIEILQQMGGNIEFSNGDIICSKSELKAVEVDVDGIPDAVPVLAIAMATASGKSILKNVARLKIKESDRVATVIEMLTKLGISAKEVDNSIEIIGGKLQFGVVNSHNDHRIAMASAIGGLCGEGVDVIGADAVEKSYPSFFEDVVDLGGLLDVKI